MATITMSDGAPAPAGPDAVERRVLDAALCCLARWGVAKTTLDDIAREARVSRATVYRAFPGGKDTVLDAIVVDELSRFAGDLGERLLGTDDLEDLLVTGITFASQTLTGHEALQYLLAHEPEQVLPHISFGRFDGVLAAASGLVAPHLARFVGEELALRTGEWVTRLVFSYTMAPSPTYDFTDADDVRRFVRSYLLPGLTDRTTAPAAPPHPRND
ncbi:MAG: TetR/AcrR family transcriptional regulator [Acidimicrobiales bacterium]